MEFSNLRFLDRRMTPHLHSRRSPAYCRVDRVVESTGAFLAFSCLFVVVAFAALLQASGRIRRGIFEMLCLSIRTFARVLIGMQDRLFSIVRSERLAGYGNVTKAYSQTGPGPRGGAGGNCIAFSLRPCRDIWVRLGSVELAFGSSSQRSRSE